MESRKMTVVSCEEKVSVSYEVILRNEEHDETLRLMLREPLEPGTEVPVNLDGWPNK